jgi:hypothetical protein
LPSVLNGTVLRLYVRVAPSLPWSLCEVAPSERTGKGHLMSLAGDAVQNGGAWLRFELGAAKSGAFEGFPEIYGFCDRMMP